MKNISALVAALLLTGILGLSATFVNADSNEDIPTSALRINKASSLFLVRT